MDCGVVTDDFNQNFQLQIPHMMMMMPTTQLPLSVDLDSLSLGFLVEKQKEEIERYLHEQSMNVRLAMQQLLKQQYTSLIRRLESRAATITRKKDEELVMMSDRILQLETYLRNKEEEKDAWEKLAREKEALVLSLNNALEQLQNPCLSSTGEAEESTSSSSSSSSDNNDNNRRRRKCCKICGVRCFCCVGICVRVGSVMPWLRSALFIHH